MALAKVTSVSASAGSGATTFSVTTASFSVNAGEMLVVVEMETDNNNVDNIGWNALSTTMTGVTFSTAVSVQGIVNPKWGACRISYWYNNSGATKTGTITSSGTPASGGIDTAYIDCITISGAQSTIGATATKSAAVANTSPTVTITGFNTGSWAVGGLISGSSGPCLANGTGDTVFGNAGYSTDATLSRSTTAVDWSAAAIEIKVLSTTGVNSGLMLMGLGS